MKMENPRDPFNSVRVKMVAKFNIMKLNVKNYVKRKIITLSDH